MVKKSCETEIAKDIDANFLHRKYRILSKFNDIVILPSEALDVEFWKIRTNGYDEHLALRECIFTTIDGINVRLEFITTWATECVGLEEECVRCFNLTLDKLKSIFYSRCSTLSSSCWHKIRMIKV